MAKQQKGMAVINNMMSQIVVQFITLIAGILVPRFIILHYGSEINGLASGVTQIINYASLLEAGLGTASIHALYKPLAQNDRNGVNAVCASAKKFFTKVGLYFVIAVFAVASIYPFLVKGETSKLTVALLILVISSTNALEYFVHAKFRVLLTADQKLYIVGYSRAVGILLQTAIKLALIFMGAHIIIVYLVSSFVLLLRIFFVKIYAKKKYAWLDFSVKPDDHALVQRKALVWHQIAGLVVNNTSTIVISTAIPSGLNLASVFSVYNMVVQNIYNLITGAFSNGVVASFGQIKELKDEKQFAQIYRRYEFGYYIFISVIYGTMATMLIPFVRLYTKSADINYISYSIAALFIIVGVLNASRVPGSMLINAAGHFTQTRNRAIIEAIINVVFMFILVWPLKIEGVLLASVISFLYRVPDIVIYINKHILNSSPVLSIRRIIRMWIACFLSTILLQMTLIPSNINSWKMWLLWSIVSVFVTAAVAFAINFVFERKEFIAVIKDILNRASIKVEKRRGNE